MSRAALSIERIAAAALHASIPTLFWRLGVRGFWDPDEAHHPETLHEMLTTGDWFAPFYNEQPFFDKPALFHQLQSRSMVVFGPYEFAARLVPALVARVLDEAVPIEQPRKRENTKKTDGLRDFVADTSGRESRAQTPPTALALDRSCRASRRRPAKIPRAIAVSAGSSPG